MQSQESVPGLISEPRQATQLGNQDFPSVLSVLGETLFPALSTKFKCEHYDIVNCQV